MLLTWQNWVQSFPGLPSLLQPGPRVEAICVSRPWVSGLSACRLFPPLCHLSAPCVTSHSLLLAGPRRGFTFCFVSVLLCVCHPRLSTLWEPAIVRKSVREHTGSGGGGLGGRAGPQHWGLVGGGFLSQELTRRKVNGVEDGVRGCTVGQAQGAGHSLARGRPTGVYPERRPELQCHLWQGRVAAWKGGHFAPTQ